MSRLNNVQQPLQRLPYKKKDEEWRKDNLDFADRHSFYHNSEVRQTLKNKIINLNLYNGIVDVRDLTNVVNPHQQDASFTPDNIPHHPIIVPKIDLLVGEEIKRRFDWSVVVTNADAITKKEEDKKAFYIKKLTEFLQANYSDEELQAKMQELQKHMKYNWQDIREKMANQILKYYYQKELMPDKFSKGFKDALIMGEEIYLISIVHNEPTLTKLNPLKVHAIRNGNSDRIDDAAMIIIEDYKSPNQLVDEYYEVLTPDEIDELMEYSTKSSKGTYSEDYDNHTLFRDSTENVGIYETLFELAELNGHTFTKNYTDINGNIRELRLRWKSLKKVKEVKYYDEYGEVQYRYEAEEYILDKALGEESKDMWINETWEGIKLGKDIYLKIRPLEVQFTDINNPSKSHMGIIGQIYNTNQGRAVSMMDRAKNLQYFYDAIVDRLNKSIATNYGKIMELDISKIPANWEVEKWMHFAIVNKIAVVDSFKEGNHGAATGKLAGSFNTQGGRTIDMETGSYIQQHIQLLEFIKREMGEVCGVSQQREGQVSNRETVGGVERAVNQSSHVTEYWFATHEGCKLRVLEAFLEAAKIALRDNKNPKAQYIMDDSTIQMLNMEDEEWTEMSYGILVGATSKAIELENAIKQYAQAFIQNGGNMSTIMDIYFSPSIMDMRRKLEIAEEEIHQRNSEASQQQSKQAQAELEYRHQIENLKLQLEDKLNQRDNDTKLQIAGLQKESTGDDISPEDDSNLDQQKHEADVDLKQQKLNLELRGQNLDMQKHNDNLESKKVDQSIARIKKKSSA